MKVGLVGLYYDRWKLAPGSGLPALLRPLFAHAFCFWRQGKESKEFRSSGVQEFRSSGVQEFKERSGLNEKVNREWTPR
jgi:hypothetical protein